MDVKTAGRTVEIFETFAKAQQPLSLSEISRALGAPLSSCLYIVRALEKRGYLYAVGARKNIYPTRKLLNMARLIMAGEAWIEQVEPVLMALRDATGETVILAKRQHNKVVYLAVYEGTQTIRYSSAVGDLKPLHSSSIGKALLGAMDAKERKKLVAKLSLGAVTESTITDRDVLIENVERAHQDGFAVTRGENVADVMAVARPILLGREHYGVALAGPYYRIEKRLESLLGQLREACSVIETSD